MTDERRRFYRIDDQVSLALKPISEIDIDARLGEFWANQHAFSIRNNYNFEIEQHIADFHKIEKSMPELARYLGVLQKQIDLITEQLTREDSRLALVQKTANLSAQGIAYYGDDSLEPNSLAELNLKLLPSGFMLVIIARVIDFQTALNHAQGNNRISLDFEHIQEADREILIKYIHARQMKSLSSAKTQEN